MSTVLIILITAAVTAWATVWWDKQMHDARLRMLLAGAKDENERIASKTVALYYGVDVTEAEDAVWRRGLQIMEDIRIARNIPRINRIRKE